MNLRLFQISNLRTIELKVIGLKHIIRMLNTDYMNGTGKGFYTVLPQKTIPQPPSAYTHTHTQKEDPWYLLSTFDSTQRE